MGCCYGNQLIWGNFLLTSKLIAYSLCCGILIRNAVAPCAYDVTISNDAATSCKNLVNFAAVTSEIMFLICVPFVWLLGENWPTISIRRAGICKHAE